MNPFNHKKSRWILGSFLLIMLFFTIFGQKGLIKIVKLHQNLSHLEERKVYLEANNESLTDSIYKMKHQKAYQEREIRETLGLVEDDEIVYEFQD